MARKVKFGTGGGSAFRKGSDRYIEPRFSGNEQSFHRRTTPTAGFRSRPYAKKGGGS
jgi:hypothetical protein